MTTFRWPADFERELEMVKVVIFWSFTILHHSRSDVLTKEEAIRMLMDNEAGKNGREETMKAEGYPAYTTQVGKWFTCSLSHLFSLWSSTAHEICTPASGWMGFSDEKMQSLCKEFLAMGFKGFKVKVGGNLEHDIHRLRLVRDVIGYDNYLVSIRCPCRKLSHF